MNDIAAILKLFAFIAVNGQLLMLGRWISKLETKIYELEWRLEK